MCVILLIAYILVNFLILKHTIVRFTLYILKKCIIFMRQAYSWLHIYLQPVPQNLHSYHDVYQSDSEENV